MKNIELWHWVYISGEKTGYIVSTLGNLKIAATGEKVNFHLSDKGYCRVYLRKTWLPDNIERTDYLLHRLVLESFVPIDNVSEMTGDHIDKDKLNNKLSNLRWLTRQENSEESHKFGRIYLMGSNLIIINSQQIKLLLFVNY